MHLNMFVGGDAITMTNDRTSLPALKIDCIILYFIIDNIYFNTDDNIIF